MFYQFDQNNSGGSFVIDDKLCHRLFIEADNYIEAEEKAFDMGVYFDGCEKGLDCSCCGDRWYSGDELDLNSINEKGYTVSEMKSGYGGNPEYMWEAKYRKYNVLVEPQWREGFAFPIYEGKIQFANIEEYVGFLTTEYGYGKGVEARIFYKDGKVKEYIK